MKFLVLLTLLSCSTHPLSLPFEESKDCAPEALKFMKTSSPLANRTYTEAQISERTSRLTAPIQDCYQKELDRNERRETLNVCFVAGYDPQGEQVASQFSALRASYSADFSECMNKIDTKKLLGDLKNINILQPFTLSPTQTH